MKPARALVISVLLPASVFAQGLPPAASPSPPPTSDEETIIPTFETQKLARTYILDIPAPRGQITDRTGLPLAQNKVSYNLAISFPTPLDFTDAKAVAFAREKIDKAAKLIGRSIKISDDAILRHYHNRGILPLEIAQNLSKSEYEAVKDQAKDFLVVRPIYVRTYPNGKVAGQIVGYTGKTGRNLVPGNNVITTLDLRLQQLAEKALESKAKRGAIVIVDPTDGDILAMASWPTYDPNLFVPSISAEKFKQLQDDPDIPLLARAFRSAYPPGSTFKVAVGIAALETSAVRPDDLYQCVPGIQIGNLTFHNWKKGDQGALNFVQALTQSCDTWFYQVGIKTGAEPIIEWALKLGFGAKCGIPLRGEAEGRVPNDEYMKATHGRKLLNGDIANLSIGQGDTQTTPLQMAQAMAIIANGGRFYQTRLVRQVQSVDHEIVTAYELREKRSLNVSAATMEQIRTGMIEVVNGSNGTGHEAQLDGVEVAGKTGTAQWGPKNKERTAAWFAGFLPAEEPRYAFAAVYEGDVGSKVHGGTTAAPMIADIFQEIYKGSASNKRSTRESTQQVRRAQPVEEDASD